MMASIFFMGTFPVQIWGRASRRLDARRA